MWLWVENGEPALGNKASLHVGFSVSGVEHLILAFLTSDMDFCPHRATLDTYPPVSCWPHVSLGVIQQVFNSEGYPGGCQVGRVLNVPVSLQDVV